MDNRNRSSYLNLTFVLCAGQSVLLQDEAKHNGHAGGDVAINMDGMDRSRYQQQLQLIDEQVDNHSLLLLLLLLLDSVFKAITIYQSFESLLSR